MPCGQDPASPTGPAPSSTQRLVRPDFMKISPLTALAAFGLLSPSVLAQDSKPDVLSRIRDVFAAIDANKDGKIDLAEATKERVATRDFTAQDIDKSASLDPAEFLVYYRQLLVTAGRKVPADLDAEIRRVEAERRKALEAERAAAAKRQAEAEAKAEEDRLAEARRKEAEAAAAKEAAATEAQPAPGTPQPAAADPAAAAALVQRLVDGGTLSAEEGRDMLRGLSDPSGVATDPQALEGIRGAVLRAQPRILALVQGGQLTADEGRTLSAAFLERATAAGTAIAALSESAPVRGEAPAGGRSQRPADAEDAPGAARQMLERLAENGRLTRQEVDAMAVALQNPAAFAGDTVKLNQIRGAVNRIRPRLGAMVQQGKLTADEARALSLAFQARGQAAARELAAAEAGGEPRPGGGSERPAATERPGAPDAAPGGRPPAGGPGADEVMSPRDAQQLLGRLIAEGAVSAEEGSGWLAALGEQQGADAAQLRQVRDALAAARPRISTLVQEGKLTTNEGRGLANWFNRRAKQVGQALAKQQPGKGRGPKPEPAVGEEPGRRAQAYVRRLITEGRVSAGEGRVMYQAMTDPSTIAEDATQLEGLRAALEQTRPRVGELVRQGHLTAEEGRELSSVFDARATAAATALKAIQDAEQRRKEKEKVNTAGRRNGAGQGARNGKQRAKGGDEGKGGDAGRPAGDPQRKGGEARTPARQGAGEDARSGGRGKAKAKGRDGRGQDGR